MYRLTNPIFIGAESNIIIRLSDGANIPVNPANTDYQEYLRWLEAGNQPLPAENQ